MDPIDTGQKKLSINKKFKLQDFFAREEKVWMVTCRVFHYMLGVFLQFF